MTLPRLVATLVVALVATTIVFWIVLHQISSVWLDVALGPDVRQSLERSMEDQKRLRRLDPARREEYRREFERNRVLLARMAVLRANREAMLQRFEIALVALFAIAAGAAAFMLTLRYRAAQERERRDYLERVASLQETTRRLAHEIKGPLAAARLELERLGDDRDVVRAQESIGEELERLARFTRAFTTFAGLGAPVLRRESLHDVVREFCTVFAGAWPGVELRDRGGDAEVCADRDMVRQVLVNLCTNSASAGAKSVVFAISGRALEVRDDGAGVPESLRARIFDPYVTTRRIGDGMGLGLSISRKVMLDHGGDLVLASTSAAGTTFRLQFGDAACS
jgi:signal transduction histidine kinase